MSVQEFNMIVKSVDKIHDDVIVRWGGQGDILDLAGVESAAGATLHRLDEHYVPSAIFLMKSLIQNHPYKDGNKRTAFGAMLGYIRYYSNYTLIESAESCARKVWKIASGDYEEGVDDHFAFVHNPTLTSCKTLYDAYLDVKDRFYETFKSLASDPPEELWR